MSRVEALKEIQKKMNKVEAQREPISPFIACAIFLEQIAGSLAVIADVLAERKEGEQNGGD